MSNNTYERKNGVQIIAKDFITDTGKKLSQVVTENNTAAQWGGVTGDITDQTDLQAALDLKEDVGGGGGGDPAGHHKVLANNAETPIFSFPLAEGDVAGFTLNGVLLAKKDSDYSVASFVEPFVVYNNAGTLVVSVAGNHLTDSGGSMISEDVHTGAVDVVGVQTPGATLLAGVVTVTFNPGDVGTAPDSIALDYIVINPTDADITYL